jgi:hypothetical protein
VILVDRARWPAHGTRFAHLVSDTSLEELHAFVETLSLPRPLRFHRDHYDVPASAWNAVVGAGASVVSAREVVLALRGCGLRR